MERVAARARVSSQSTHPTELNAEEADPSLASSPPPPTGRPWPVLLGLGFGLGQGYADCERVFNPAAVPGFRIEGVEAKVRFPVFSFTAARREGVGGGERGVGGRERRREGRLGEGAWGVGGRRTEGGPSRSLGSSSRARGCGEVTRCGVQGASVGLGVVVDGRRELF